MWRKNTRVAHQSLAAYHMLVSLVSMTMLVIPFARRFNSALVSESRREVVALELPPKFSRLSDEP